MNAPDNLQQILERTKEKIAYKAVRTGDRNSYYDGVVDALEQALGIRESFILGPRGDEKRRQHERTDKTAA
jgi:hypothetical protein